MRWTKKPIRAYWGHQGEAVQDEAVRSQGRVRSVAQHKLTQQRWYPYLVGRGMPRWLSLSGIYSFEPVPMSWDEMEHRKTLDHWAQVKWTSDPSIKVAESVTESDQPTPDEIEKAAKETHPEPTDGQKECGNYAKGHIKLHGFDISIENASGSERSGKDGDGKEWSVKMPCCYGYIKGTQGPDKDHLDVYIGKSPESQKVFVINQKHKEGGFDEHKIMLGFTNKFRAVRCYDKAFNDGLGRKLREEVIEATIQS